MGARRTRSASPYVLAGLLTVTGSLHFIAPRPYAAIVPSWLPNPTGLVFASGVAELLCATGLAVPRTRRLAGWASGSLVRRGVPGERADGAELPRALGCLSGRRVGSVAVTGSADRLGSLRCSARAVSQLS